MKILRIKDDPDRAVVEAVRVLKSGGIIAYPTETFYALGVNAMDETSLRKLYILKGRAWKKPLPVIIGDKRLLKTLVKEIPYQAKRLIKRFWPGPLTIVLEATSNVPEILTAKTGKIAIRIPGDETARDISKRAKFPITSTSANPSGKSPASRPEEVIEYFSEKIDLLIDKGRTEGLKPSTIVDLTTDPMKVLREGAIPSEDILDLD